MTYTCREFNNLAKRRTRRHAITLSRFVFGGHLALCGFSCRGNTVNVADASYSNSIGDPFMAAAWTDPDFDAEQRAFYYVRVLEIPTPTWLAFDVKYFDIDLPDDALMQGQERAYTSAIWYTP